MIILDGVELGERPRVGGVERSMGDLQSEPDALENLVGGLEGCDDEIGDCEVGGGTVELDGFAHCVGRLIGGLEVNKVGEDLDWRCREVIESREHAEARWV